ncbi:14761_t:CDS:2 [Rhizophagus irregularis]|nr:14761_t:CDS:2 [Rhizophagus irregularis]
MIKEINDLDFENSSVDLPLKDEINLSKCNGFEDDDEVEDRIQFLKRYATQIEFETKIVRVEKKDDVYAQKTYKCRHGGNQELLHQFALSLRKIPVNVKEEIHFLVQDCQLGATVLKRILRKKFSDQEIYHQDLYN